MRDIKFRAYSHDTKTMYPCAIQGFNGELWVHKNIPHNGEWKNIGCGNDEEIVDYSYELMQFTGLLDKNGEEIYEGDIIIFDNILPRRNEPFIVEEIKGMFCIENPLLNFEYCPLAFIVDSPHVEIIGNIYENPELLKS